VIAIANTPSLKASSAFVLEVCMLIRWQIVQQCRVARSTCRRGNSRSIQRNLL